MLRRLSHRGPDESGIFRAREVGLAHARLSIIDLSSGRQPMTNEDGTLWIVFNGEIFNYVELREALLRRGHRFASRSDTEVVIHLYEEKGPGALEDLNGQFAFALWDTRKRELFLARDRMGIRPLYYGRGGKAWVFGSEIKAIFESPDVSRRIDPVALDDVLTFWSPLAPRTAFEGISELPPAHWMRIDAGGATSRRYWDLPPQSDPPGARTESDCAEALKALLVDATRLQLRSDVPVGAYLSGGLDSSVTAALVRGFTESPLSTFSVTFRDPEFDESRKQRIMVAFLGTEHRAVACGDEEIAAAFPEVIWHAEAPIVRTAPAPLFLLSRRVRDAGFKVILTGEGADEILAGYDLFKEDKVRRFVEADPRSTRRALLLRRLYPYLRHSPTRSLAYASAFFGAPAAPFHDAFRSHAPRWNTTSGAKVFLSEDVRRAAGAEPAAQRVVRALGVPGGDPLDRAQGIEIRTLLPGYILSSQGDRMAMAHGVEGRFPFLDHRVVELALRIPPRFRLRGLREKSVLRCAMRGLLPDEILGAVKQPYRAPDARCFASGEGARLAGELLAPASLAESGLFDAARVGALQEKLRSGRLVGFKDNMAFVAILSTQLLHRLFVRRAGVPEAGEPVGTRVIEG